VADNTVLVVDYTSRDYAAFRDDMLANATTLLPEWTSRSSNDFGVVLVELFAYMGDILSFYGDRIANEAFLQTATQRSSVLSIAAMLDYRPNGTAAASATLTFTTAPGTAAITIPAGTRVSTLALGTEPIYFETNVDLTIAGTTATPNVFTGTVLATEGITVYETIGTSDGTAGQEYLLTQSPVIENSLDVYMDEGSGSITVWQWVDHLIEWGAGDRVFTTLADENNVTHVIFGDGVNGKIPVALTAIQAGYRVGGGDIGNVGPGTLTTLDSPVTGVISVTNAQAATGGQNAETLDQIRVSAPQSLIALNRAVTLSDYESLATSVPGIAKANALSAVYTSVTLYIAPLGGGLDASGSPIYVNSAVKQNVRNYLASRVPAPTTVTLADPTYVQIDVLFNLVVAPQYNQKTVEAAVLTAVSNVFDFDDAQFGERVTLGAVYSAINSVIGVGYATITTLARHGGSGVADVQLAANEFPVVGTVTSTTSGGIVLG